MRRWLTTIVTAVLIAMPLGALAGDKRIALSFDDGPRGDGPYFTGRERGVAFIDALARAQAVPSVFFVTTRGMATEEGAARIGAYAAAGHLIANHSHTHQWGSRVEVDAYITDIAEADRQLRGIQNFRSWYRFPYLDEGRPAERRDAYRSALGALGLTNGYVTIDTYDWYIEGQWLEAKKAGRTVDLDALGRAYVDLMMTAVRFFDDKAREGLGRAPAQVLLLHENDVGALFIGDLVTALRAEGWEIISPDEAYRDPLADETPRTLFSGQGRIASVLVDRGWPAASFDHPAADEAAIDRHLAAYAVFGAPAP